MYTIGVDIGGTNIKIGLVDNQLNIIRRSSIPFPHLDGAGVAAKIAEESRKLLQEHGLTEDELDSVGVVVPGSIDPTGSIVINAHNLGFHDVPLKAQLQACFDKTTVYLANDADGAALAELGKGAFVGHETAVLFTLGTGVGGGVILGGKMFSGGMRHGIEMGHMPLVFGGKPCTCGNRGCIEAHCSATALSKDGVLAMKAHPESLLAQRCGNDESKVDAKLVIDCAKEGDAAALAVFHDYVDHLAAACISTVHLLDPEVIAIGGGVCGAGDFLFEPLRRKALELCFFDDMGQIVPAVMGNDAGIVGAAMLGQNAMN